MRAAIFLSILSILGNSCSSPKNRTNVNIREIAIDVDTSSIINLSQVYNSVHYTILQTTPNNLVGSIDKLQRGQGRLFLLDTKTNKIAIFSNCGTFIAQTENEGRGPNEYNYIEDFEVDTLTGTIEYHDVGNLRMIKSDLEGLPISSRIFNHVRAFNFSKLNPNRYVFVAYNYPTPQYFGEQSYSVVVMDTCNNLKETYLPIKGELEYIVSTASNRVVRYNNGVNIFIPYRNELFYVDNNGCRVPYRFLYKKYKLPEKVLQEYKINKGSTSRSRDYALSVLNSRLNAIRHIGFEHNFFESEDLLQFQFSIRAVKVGNYFTAIHLKAAAKTLTGIMENDLDYGPVGSPVALQNDTLYTCIYPSEIRERIAYVEKNYKLSGEALTRFQAMKTQLGDVKETDNPVIGKFCIRKDL
ncbi:MAG: 6-bladed beta-propeller [Bacteroidales bacterium]